MSAEANGSRIEARFNYQYMAAGNNSFNLDVDLQLPGRGITAVFGHSGSGKTSLLRCLAGLENADNGRLTVNDEIWQNSTTFVPTHKRPLAYVFQEASLFPHLHALGNLHFAIKRSKNSGSEELLGQVVSLMGIEGILRQYPSQLSGGERQRVAIARALLIRPRLLLMDEPLAALDFSRKQEILPYLEQLPALFDIPIVYVSHSVDEVARLADYMVVLDAGKVAASGSVTQVLSRLDLPIQLGKDSSVVLQATVMERDTRWHLLRVSCAGGELWLRDSGEKIGQDIRIRILASDVSLALQRHTDSSIQNKLPAQVLEMVKDTDAAMLLLRLQVGPDNVIARITRRSVEHLQIAVGSQVWAQIKSVAIAH